RPAAVVVRFRAVAHAVLTGDAYALRAVAGRAVVVVLTRVAVRAAAAALIGPAAVHVRLIPVQFIVRAQRRGATRAERADVADAVGGVHASSPDRATGTRTAAAVDQDFGAILAAVGAR